MRFGDVLLQVVDQAVNTCVTGIFRNRLGDELRLPALAMGRDNHPTGNLVGDDAAKTLANDVQAAVQRSRGTGRGDDIAVIHVEGIDIQLDVRKERLEVMFKLPVGGGPFTVEDPRPGQHKRPQTQADNFRAVVSRQHQAVEQRLRRPFKDVLPVGNDNNVGLPDGGVILRGVEGKPVF